MSYKHKSFLHFLFKNGVVTLANALQYCGRIKADEVTDLSSLKEFISVINREITKQELEIVVSVCEITGEQEVALINTANDEISKLQNVFTILQLEFFQKILHEIVTSEERKLSQIFCLNLSTKLTGKLTHVDAEKLIDRWIGMGYLVKHDNDIYLGSRCIMEFTSFFKGYCQDYIQICGLCSELVFKGKDCQSCKKLMHTHCLEMFIKKYNYCPECKQQWKNNDFSDQDSENHDHNRSSQSNDSVDENPGPSTRKRRR